MNLETKQIDRLNYFRSGLWLVAVLCLIISSLGISFCSRSSDFYDARINYYDPLGNLLPKNDTIDEQIDSYYQGKLTLSLVGEIALRNMSLGNLNISKCDFPTSQFAD